MKWILTAVVAALGIAWQTPPRAAAGPVIPLCPGLTIVTALSTPTGDYESIKTIEAVDAAGVRLRYSSEGPPPGEAGGPAQRVRTTRTIRTEDLASATRYARHFSERLPESIPRSTALGTSRAVLTALKTKGQAELGMPDVGLLPPIGGLSADDLEFDTQVVRRAGTGRVVIPVLVNNVRVDLPAIHARGEYFGQPADFHFLDDADNPLALKYAVARAATDDLLGELKGLLGELGLGTGAKEKPRTDGRDLLTVVKIAYACPVTTAPSPASGPAPPPASGPAPAPRSLEQTLAESGRADVYSIHFAFNSDQIREESEATLKEIAGVLARHPTWTLAIEGHTDNVASDSFNLDLSRRRAAAVKDALVRRYKIDAPRLTTAGHGEARPKDTNDTLEGRARNRRVELVRSSS